jgi:hypothetical protein
MHKPAHTGYSTEPYQVGQSRALTLLRPQPAPRRPRGVRNATTLLDPTSEPSEGVQAHGQRLEHALHACENGAMPRGSHL